MSTYTNRSIFNNLQTCGRETQIDDLVLFLMFAPLSELSKLGELI